MAVKRKATHRFILWLNTEDSERLKRASKRQERSMSGVLRRALRALPEVKADDQQE